MAKGVVPCSWQNGSEVVPSSWQPTPVFRRCQRFTRFVHLAPTELIGLHLHIDIVPDKTSCASGHVRNTLSSPPCHAFQIFHNSAQDLGQAVAQSGLTTPIGER